MTCLEQQQPPGPIGSLDGEGAGDHDQPYRFGRRPRMSEPYPFNTRQYARLLVFRGRLQDHLTADEEADGTSLPQAAPDSHPSDEPRKYDQLKRGVDATGRKKLIMAGLVTEVCLTRSVLAARKDGVRSLLRQ